MTELIEEILKQMHEIGEEYYSVDHSTGGVSFYEYLARRLVEAGYVKLEEKGKTKNTETHFVETPGPRLRSEIVDSWIRRTGGDRTN